MKAVPRCRLPYTGYSMVTRCKFIWKMLWKCVVFLSLRVSRHLLPARCPLGPRQAAAGDAGRQIINKKEVHQKNELCWFNNIRRNWNINKSHDECKPKTLKRTHTHTYVEQHHSRFQPHLWVYTPVISQSSFSPCFCCRRRPSLLLFLLPTSSSRQRQWNVSIPSDI